MDKVRFAVLYDEEWSNSGGKYKYHSGKSKVISVSREISYESLHDIISCLVNVNPNESSIKMKFLFNSPEVLASFEVVNDDDVQIFLCENSVVNTRTSRIHNGTENRNKSKHTSPNDFENADVFTIGVDNKDETEGSRPSNLEVPSTRSRVSSSKGLGIKLSTIHGSYTSLESVVNIVKEVGVGDLFPSKEELHMKISLLAIANHFQFKVNKSTKALLVLTCSVEDCKWPVRATKLKDCESFCVRKYQSEHTCSLDTLHFDHRQASSKLIGHCIKSKFEGASQSYRPKDIIEDMKKVVWVDF
ncbi:hypothetical protein Dsin_025425 [Dipteronia sinensis]|uniref:Transposase MuDR plant domain-containing protein n=1 Tax=Dipteronia sinensis TaxID=43782 RepID=A0AAE0DWS7_9ROSI|nr:hypothetical protein Dsin_025425 [Dipteronia sinensis]